MDAFVTDADTLLAARESVREHACFRGSADAFVRELVREPPRFLVSPPAETGLRGALDALVSGFARHFPDVTGHHVLVTGHGEDMMTGRGEDGGVDIDVTGVLALNASEACGARGGAASSAARIFSPAHVLRQIT